MIDPEAETAWRKLLAENPFRGSLRKRALEAEAA